MFSPLNDPQLEQWFQHFNAPLKRLPAEERAALHLEVRQHLEELAKANEELGSSPGEAWQFALEQFGNPAQTGRRLAWEWQRGRGLVSPKLIAIVYGIGAYAISTAGIIALAYLVPKLTSFVIGTDFGYSFPTEGCFIVGVPIVVGLTVGRKYPHQALTSAVHTALVLPIMPTLAEFLVRSLAGILGPVEVWQSSVFYVVTFSSWLLLTCGAAYFASVTKRGWYRPTLADFKLTLPRRRRQISRNLT